MLPASAGSSCCRWSAARRRTFCGLPAWTNFDGKIVLDASDPLDFSFGRPGLFVGTSDSLGERIQRLIPDAYVVKGSTRLLRRS